MTPRQDMAIRVSHLSKMYKVYSRPADMFWEMVTAKPRFRPFWALTDVSFDVPRGSVVGIMGRNGAGKSTLLKIISGTLDKTSGDICVNGRLSSILELGTGFNLEYTGRQNIYLGGLMVGMTRDEVNRKMDWIIEFSELERVIDQPFKTYSTGMQARLTFSTAVCIEPDILIIDEALSVGDAKFARKCYSKIEEFREAGHTILVVSHDINTISTFCDHAILLEQGKIFDQGAPYYMSQVYYQLLFASPEHQPQPAGTSAPTPVVEDQEPVKSPDISPRDLQTEECVEEHSEAVEEASPVSAVQPRALQCDREPMTDVDRMTIRKFALQQLQMSEPYCQGNARQRRIGNQKAEILDYGILDDHGNRTHLLTSGNQYRLFFRTVFYEAVRGATSGFVIRSMKGVDLFGTSTLVQKLHTISAQPGTIIESCCPVTMWLTNGIYFLTVAIADPYVDINVQYDMIYDALQFEVRMQEEIFTTSIVNLAHQPIERRVLWGEAYFEPLTPSILASIH